MLWAIVFIIGVAVGVVSFVLMNVGLRSSNDKANLNRRLNLLIRVVESRQSRQQKALKKSSVEKWLSALPILHSVDVHKMLRLAGLNWSMFAYFLFISMCMLVGILLLILSGRTSIYNAVLFGTILGLFVQYQVIQYLIRRFYNIFLQHFPTSLEVMINSIKVGAGLERAILNASEKSTHPAINQLFERIYQRIRLGINVGSAFKSQADEMGIIEIKFLAILLGLQQEMGSALTYTLTTLQNIIKTRHTLKLKAKALSAEARASAVIVGSLPLAFSVLLYFLNPSYFSVFSTTVYGQIILNITLVWFMIGIFVLWRLTQL